MIKSNQHRFSNQNLVKIDNLCEKPENTENLHLKIKFEYAMARIEFFWIDSD
jgi:hypothetical protein